MYTLFLAYLLLHRLKAHRHVHRHFGSHMGGVGLGGGLLAPIMTMAALTAGIYYGGVALEQEAHKNSGIFWLVLALVGAEIAYKTRRRWRGKGLSSLRGFSLVGMKLPNLRNRGVGLPLGERLVVGIDGLGREVRGPKDRNVHYLAISPTGGGKSKTFLIPAMKVWPGPLVSTTTQRDLLMATLPERLAVGPVYVLDLSDDPMPLPEGVHALPYTPLAGCEVWSTALSRAFDMTETVKLGGNGAAFWSARARTLLAPCFYAAALAELNIGDVVRWVSTQSLRDAIEILERLAQTPEGREARGKLIDLESASAQHRSDAAATAATCLEAYQGKRLYAAAACELDDFDAEQLILERASVHLVVPPDYAEQCAPIVVSVIAAFYAAVRTMSSRQHGKAISPRLGFFLDELTQVAYVPALGAYLAEGGGRGCTIVAACQAWPQFTARWGEAQAAAMWPNFGYKILWKQDDPSLGRLVEQLSGTHFVHVKGSEKRVQQPRITAHQLQTLGRGRTIVFGHGKLGFTLLRFRPPK